MTHRGHAVLHAVVNGVVNAGIGGAIAWLLWQGFTFDWYVHEPEAHFERDFVAGEVAFGLFVTGIVVTLIVTALVYRAFDKGHLRADKASWFSYPEGRTRDRQSHSFIAAVAMGGALAVLGALNALVVFFVLGVQEVSGEVFFGMKIVAGAVGGAGAAVVATVFAASNLQSGAITKTPPDFNLLAKSALLSSKHAGKTVAAVLVVTMLMGVGVADIHTDVDVADVLPRGDPNTEAAHALTDRFKSAFTQQVTFQLRADADGALWEQDNDRLPNRRTAADNTNITDEVYMRAIDQLVRFVQNYEFPDPDASDSDFFRPRLPDEEDKWDPESPFVATVNIAEFYKLINWTVEGGRDAPRESYSLPGPEPAGALRYRSVHEAVRAAIPTTVDALVSPTYRQTAVLLLVEPHSEMSSKEIGERAILVRDAYLEWARANPDNAYQVFTGEDALLLTVDLPVANAHSSELAEQDFKLLLPLISYFIILSLFVAFRSATSIIVTFSSLAIGVVWTFGAMGYLDIPLNTLNLTTIPLIMGVGIDYGIHMVNEWQQHRAAGRDNAHAFRMAGSRTAIALLVATLTTIGGLMVMVVSPSLLIAELGLLSAIAIGSAFMLTITFVPAAVTLMGGTSRKKSYRPSVLMLGLARAVSRMRPLVAAMVIVGTVGAAYVAQDIGREEFGDPARNYLPDDPIRREHEIGLQGFYDLEVPDVKANVLVFSGNITTPESHAYMDAIEASLRARSVRGDTPEGEPGRIVDDTLRTLPFLVRTYLTVRDGAVGAGQFLAADAIAQQFADQENAPDRPYPSSRGEIETLMHEVAATPLFEFQNLFLDYPASTLAIMTFSVRAATYDEAEIVWHQVWAAVDENEALKPTDVEVAFAGNTATNYLFVAKEVPWLGYMTITAAILVFAFVLAFTGRIKPALTVLALNVATSAWWIAILPSLGIGLAITLTLPIVFIFCIGSDYALHLAMHAERSKDVGEVYATAGKGVLFSFITTFGAFVLFTAISNLAVRKTMIATSVAIAVIFVATILIVPLFYPVPRATPRDGGAESVTAAAAAAAGSPPATVTEPAARARGTEPGSE